MINKLFIAVSILLLICSGTLVASAQASQQPFDTASAARAAVQALLVDASRAMAIKPVSVVDNSPIPPSKKKNDFYSWAPYLWPNPGTTNGFPYITKDGQTNPETEAKSDKPLLRRMAMAVHTLSLAYRHTGDLKYANKAALMLRTWFLAPATRMNPNLNFGQCTPGEEKGTSTGIIDSRWFLFVVDAIPMLEPSKALTASEHNALKSWFGEYLRWLQTSTIGVEEAGKKNNHGSWYAAQVASFALFTGDRALATKMVTGARAYLDTQIDSAGRQLFELRRTKSYDYSLYNIHALIALAQAGDKLGIDLWHYNTQPGNGKNLKKSIEYMATYAFDDPRWPYPQIAEKVISLGYGDGDHFSVYYPYDLYSALRAGYAVYREPGFLHTMQQIGEKARGNRADLPVR